MLTTNESLMSEYLGQCNNLIDNAALAMTYILKSH
jgi:hypothetical protein